MSNLNLFSELSRKIFHDLINPASAALNGIELLKYSLNDKEKHILNDETFQLLEKSIGKITAQIKFFRFCYSDPTIHQYEDTPINNLDSIINDYINFTKHKIIHRNDLKNFNNRYALILCNTILIFLSLLPFEAEIYYELIDEDALVIRIENPTGKINSEILKDLTLENSHNTVNIQVRYLQELARIYEIDKKVISHANTEISITFSNNRA